MQKIYLSDGEKRLLLSLHQGKGFDGANLSPAALEAAAQRLKSLGLVRAAFASKLVCAELQPSGWAYLKDNPTLENPFDGEALQQLQKENLEYQQKIRWKERVIRNRNVAKAILYFLGLAVCAFTIYLFFIL